MQVFSSIKELKPLLKEQQSAGHSVGFVPTMGALHQGHLSLAEMAIAENNVVVISIFVNPTQFNNKSDLKKYPRTLDADLKTISSLNTTKPVFVYTPEASELYPEGVASKNYSFDGLEDEMEGKYRSGHFDGVATVVKQFFLLIEPDKAYFGEKDFQQLLIIKKMVDKEKLSVNIVSCPISRESSGLAMSSRNKRLTDAQQKEAAFIFKILNQIKNDFGTKNAKEISNWVEQQFKNNNTLQLEYFHVADETTLKPLPDSQKDKTNARAFIAVYAGDVRLIDNIALN